MTFLIFASFTDIKWHSKIPQLRVSKPKHDSVSTHFSKCHYAFFLLMEMLFFFIGLTVLLRHHFAVPTYVTKTTGLMG